MSPEKLIRMANQIATFFESQSDGGPEAVAAHINDFWEPRMRAQLLAIGAAEMGAGQGAGAADTRTPGVAALRPIVRAALPLLRHPQPA